MLTGRSWDIISQSNGASLATTRNENELDTIQSKVSSGRFILAITEILAALPREMLLLLKTNDLIRAVDESLGVGNGGTDHMLRLLSVQGWYCARAVKRETYRHLREKMSFVGTFASREYWGSLVEYATFSMRLLMIEAYLKVFGGSI